MWSSLSINIICPISSAKLQQLYKYPLQYHENDGLTTVIHYAKILKGVHQFIVYFPNTYVKFLNIYGNQNALFHGNWYTDIYR